VFGHSKDLLTVECMHGKVNTNFSYLFL